MGSVRCAQRQVLRISLTFKFLSPRVCRLIAARQPANRRMLVLASPDRAWAIWHHRSREQHCRDLPNVLRPTWPIPLLCTVWCMAELAVREHLLLGTAARPART